jgi:two-component system, OmpR family, response regulator
LPEVHAVIVGAGIDTYISLLALVGVLSGCVAAVALAVRILSGGSQVRLSQLNPRPHDDPRSMRAHLLLVEDDTNLRSMLESALRHHKFEVASVCTGRQALEAVDVLAHDLLVLDVMLPDCDGFEVCRRLRSRGVKLPVVFLTARDAVEDKVRGLELGGDDYLVKPFSIEELVARIDAVLRRAGTNAATSGVLQCGDLTLDDSTHRVTLQGDEIDLSPTEFNLLRFLMENEGLVMSKSQILANVWDFDFGGDGGIVETYIGYLRRKIDVDEPKLIRTIRGVGYTLRVPG